MAGLAISETWWKDLVKSTINNKEIDSLLEGMQDRRKRSDLFFPNSADALDSKLAKLKKKYGLS